MYYILGGGGGRGDDEGDGRGIGYTKEWGFKFDERKKKEEVPELAKYVERRK